MQIANLVGEMVPGFPFLLVAPVFPLILTKFAYSIARFGAEAI